MLDANLGAGAGRQDSDLGRAIGRCQSLQLLRRSNLMQMPHRIFEIDEILRVVAWQTRLVSKATAVSLACCCKAFEEPALNPLWVYQSLNKLLPLLSSILTNASEPTARPTKGGWKRFRRYTSWIRTLIVDLMWGMPIPQELSLLLDLIASPSSDGLTQQTTTTMFPNLHELEWYGEPSFLTYLPSFVPPVLTILHVYIVSRREVEYLPEEYAPLALVINSTISPSNLRSLRLETGPEADRSPELRQSIADLVLRCGPALEEFEVEFELPESAVLHLMSLPNLSVWNAVQPAPTALLSSQHRPPVSLAKMRYLNLRTATPRGWLSFISDLVGGKSYPPPAPRASALIFGNLTHFMMDSPKGQECPFSCTFPLTDLDISLLADTLPRLERISLGIPCVFNTCKTTFRSLHTLSTRCPQLRHLGIHVNMATLVQDIETISREGGQQTESQGPRLGPKFGRRSCKLGLQFAQYLPLEANVGVDDLEVVVRGFFDISAVIEAVIVVDLNSKLWAKVSERIKVIGV